MFPFDNSRLRRSIGAFTLIESRASAEGEATGRQHVRRTCERHARSAFTLIESRASAEGEATGRQHVRRTCERRARSAFTLIELLVVIAIISMLAAILLPVLAASRQKARQMVCINIVKQYGLAFAMYDDDAAGYYPFETMVNSSGVPQTYTSVADGTVRTKPMNFLSGFYKPMEPYFSSGTVWYRDWERVTTKPSASSAYVDRNLICPENLDWYEGGRYAGLANEYNYRPARLGAYRQSAQMAWDQHPQGRFEMPAYRTISDVAIHPDTYIYMADYGFHMQEVGAQQARLHRDGWNVGFVDGHVALYGGYNEQCVIGSWKNGYLNSVAQRPPGW